MTETLPKASKRLLAYLVPMVILCAPAAASDRSPAACDVVGVHVAADTSAGHSREVPPNPDGPTRVGIGFEALDIRDIIPVDSSFEYRGYIRSSWCDPRLAFEGTLPKVFSGEQVGSLIEKMWYPQGYPANKVGALDLTERVLRIYPDGTVLQDLNVAVRLAAHYDLRRFPFDEQNLELQIESYIWDRDTVQLVVDDAMSGFQASIDLPEWTIVEVDAAIDEVKRMRGDTPFSRYTMRLRIARNPGFYVWKVFLPLTVIVALSWSVFWMTNESFASRSRISATGVLTIVAYQFVFATDLPRIGYLTILDKMMIWSFGLLAITVLESMIVTHVVDSNPSLAKRIDRFSRLLFPAVYLFIFATILNF